MARVSVEVWTATGDAKPLGAQQQSMREALRSEVKVPSGMATEDAGRRVLLRWAPPSPKPDGLVGGRRETVTVVDPSGEAGDKRFRASFGKQRAGWSRSRSEMGWWGRARRDVRSSGPRSDASGHGGGDHRDARTLRRTSGLGPGPSFDSEQAAVQERRPSGRRARATPERRLAQADHRCRRRSPTRRSRVARSGSGQGAAVPRNQGVFGRGRSAAR